MQRLVEPVFRDLSKEESEQLLRTHNVGRLAFSSARSVDIRPLHYVFADGWLFGRTAEGSKLHALRHNQWVAFEVDEIASPLDWVSVVARGTFYLLHSDGSIHDVRLYQRGVDSIRKLAPEAFSDSDPVSFRTALFGISIGTLSGRSCSTQKQPSL